MNDLRDDVNMFIEFYSHYLASIFILQMRANGWRYPLVGRTRQRHFDGTSLKPRKVLENAPTPTSRVHAVLGALTERKTRLPQKDNTANLTKFYTQLCLWQQLTKTFAEQKHLPVEKSTLQKNEI
jgi:hypothetical protein